MSKSEDGRGYGLGQCAGERPAYQPPDEQDVELARWFVAEFGPGWVPNPNGQGGLLAVPAGDGETDVPAALPAGWREAGAVDDTSGGNGMRYRKKPVEVEAIQWTGDNTADVKVFVGDRQAKGGETPRSAENGECGFLLASEVSGRYTAGDAIVYDRFHDWVPLHVGDWVIRGVRRELYPCEPGVFAQTYDRADTPADANLGLASTRELLAELAARIEVDGANGGGGLDYRTVSAS